MRSRSRAGPGGEAWWTGAAGLRHQGTCAAGLEGGHRMMGVIPGGDQRPGQQDVSVPGARLAPGVAAQGRPVTGTTVRSDHQEPRFPERAAGWRGTGDRHRPAALRGSSARSQRWVPVGPIPQALPTRHRFVSRSVGAATASPPAAQAGNHIVDVTPAHPVRSQPGHGYHDLRRQPDRTARGDHHGPRLGPHPHRRRRAPGRLLRESHRNARRKETRKEGRNQ